MRGRLPLALLPAACPCLRLMPHSRPFPLNLARPSQAANSRALANPLGSTTVAAIAVAVTGPIPGIVARRWLNGLLRCQAISDSFSKRSSGDELPCAKLDLQPHLGERGARGQLYDPAFFALAEIL
jgi:hypothetical protein